MSAAYLGGSVRQSADLADPDAERKHFATLQARAALVGVALVRSTDDRDRPVFRASKWTLTRELQSVEEVEQFLRQIGGAKA